MAEEDDLIERDAPDAESEDDDRAYALEKRTVAAILAAVDEGDAAKLTELMEPLHQADIADLLEQLKAYDRRRLIELYGPEFDGEIL
ncbi:MAG TPA: magnesium transporter, partial [Rhodobacteraceae bacterium]|nr:magnesium transporter [Paracoccaceae bacterium]